MPHAHAAIWKERGLLIAKGSPIKHQAEILELLKEVQLPKEVAVIHCRGHQRSHTSQLRGNVLAGKATKTAAQEHPILQAVALRPDSPPFPMVPSYTPEETEWAKYRGLKRDLSGWLTEDNKLLIPGAKQWKIIKHFHESSHLGWDFIFKLVLRCSWARDCPKPLKMSPGHVTL